MHNFPNPILLPSSTDINAMTFNDYYYRLKMLAQAVFEWKGLPNGIEERYIERYLFQEGKCVFFKDFEKGWMIARYTTAGDLNYYDEPTKVSPVCTNYTPANTLEPGINCALIWNNDCAIPSHYTILQYAYRLMELQRTIDINVDAQKTPVVILCSEKQRKTFKAIFKQWKGNEPLIFGDKSLEGLDLVKALKTDAPIVFDKLHIEKMKLWNECMTFLGINNSNQDKRERLVADEVAANDEQIDLSAQVMLKARQTAAKKMSELCGCEITCELRGPSKAVQSLQDALFPPDDEGGGEA